MTAPESTAEMWAAIAAVASAVTAIGSFLWQRRTALDSIRPELILDDYTAAIEGGTFCLRAASVRNLGTGPAYSVWVTVPGDGGKSLTLAGGADRLSVVEPGGKESIRFEVFDWRSPRSDDDPIRSIRATVSCMDRMGNRHDVEHTFLRSTIPVGLTQPVAPGVYLAERSTTTTSGWRSRGRVQVERATDRLKKFLRRIPGVRRLVPPRGLLEELDALEEQDE